VIVRELLTKLGFVVDDKKVKSFNDKINKVKDTMRVASLAATGLLGTMFKFASDSEETGAKFNTAFRGIEHRANQTAKSLGKDYLLSRLESKRLLSATGDLLKGFGATGDQALDTSFEVQKLSADLASYNNLQGGTKRASEIVTKALLGERDALTSLGVKVSEEDVKNEIFRRGQQRLTGQARLLARANATLTLIQRQSGDATGDVARTSGSAANQMRLFKARLSDTAVTFGKVILPIITKFISKINDLLKLVDDLSPTVKNLAVGFLALVAVAGPALKIFSSLLTVWGALIKVVQFLNFGIGKTIIRMVALRIATIAQVVAAGVMKVATVAWTAVQWLLNIALLANPIGLIVALIGLLVLAILDVIKKFNRWKGEWIKIFKIIKEVWIKSWNATKNFMKRIDDFISKTIDDIIEFFVNLKNNIVQVWNDIINTITKFIDDTKRLIQDFVKSDAFEILAAITPGLNVVATRQVIGGETVPQEQIVQNLSKNQNLAQNNQTFDVKNEIQIGIPPGTSETQKRFVQKEVDKAVRRSWDANLRNIEVQNPEVE
jgi:hypothetical protein